MASNVSKYRALGGLTWIALLAAVNVGGARKISMETLREVFAGCGCQNPQTYIQSGNVIFRHAETDPSKLTQRLENALEDACGLRTRILLRTLAELEEVVAVNPFVEEGASEPSKLGVVFLAEPPEMTELPQLDSFSVTGERIRQFKMQLFIYFPLGIGKSKLRMSRLERALRPAGKKSNTATTRNWNSARKILDIARGL